MSLPFTAWTMFRGLVELRMLRTELNASRVQNLLEPLRSSPSTLGATPSLTVPLGLPGTRKALGQSRLGQLPQCSLR